MTRWAAAVLVAVATTVTPSSASAGVSPARPAPPPPTAATTVAATHAPAGAVSVSIPDLSAQVAAQGSRASYGLRRAACHQITGSDDETTGALAACLAAIPPGAPRT